LSSVWHDNALKAVKSNLLGSRFVEVVHKIPWGFDEINRRLIIAEDFATIELANWDTCILHILSGEGVQIETIKEVLKKALDVSTRVLILEHNPHSGYWRKEFVNCVRLSVIENTIKEKGYIYAKRAIDQRNLLYSVTAIKGMDWSFNEINNNNLNELLSYQYKNSLPEKDRNIFCLSSERQEGSGMIFDVNTARFIDSVDDRLPLYSVIGGLMFLNMIAELNRQRDFVLFDINLPQVLYSIIVVELIKANKSYAEFIMAENKDTPTLNKLNVICNVEQFIKWLRSSQIKVFRPDKGMVWVNIVKAGHWRSQYEKVRNYLLQDRAIFHFGGFPDIQIPKDSVVYTSTVEPDKYKYYKNCHIIEAFSRRDIPVLAL